MLYSAILDHNGRLVNVILGRPHGNTKYHFAIEAERLLDAEQLAQSRVQEQWARLTALKPPRTPSYTAPKRPQAPRKPKAPACTCGVPVDNPGDRCYLCRESQEPRIAKADDAVLIALLEVQRQWIQSPNVGLFTKWLGGRIAQLRAK